MTEQRPGVDDAPEPAGGQAPDETAGQTPDEAAADLAGEAGTASPTTTQAQRDLEPPD